MPRFIVREHGQGYVETVKICDGVLILQYTVFRKEAHVFQGEHWKEFWSQDPRYTISPLDGGSPDDDA